MSSPEIPVLEVRGLIRKFGDRVAVNGIDLVVQRGESVGLLGPNGAGKTTTLGMICGLTRPTSGIVRIHGQPIVSDDDPTKARIGLVPQELALIEPLSAQENLQLCGALYGLHGARLRDAIHAALDFVGLVDRASDRVSTFSGGMKRRVNLAAALLHDPDILFLDEPTVGVDPQSRNAIFDNVEELRRRGKTIVYTTHYMEEVERLCDRVIILDEGRVVADDTLANLRSQMGSACQLRIELDRSPDALVAAITALDGVLEVRVSGDGLSVRVDSIDIGLERILPVLRSAGLNCRHVDSQRPSLEHIFLQLTGRSLRDG